MQYRINAGQVRCRTGLMQDRPDAGHDECRTGPIQDRTNSVQVRSKNILYIYTERTGAPFVFNNLSFALESRKL